MWWPLLLPQQLSQGALPGHPTLLRLGGKGGKIVVHHRLAGPGQRLGGGGVKLTGKAFQLAAVLPQQRGAFPFFAGQGATPFPDSVEGLPDLPPEADDPGLSLLHL